jgi:hypothetical protein
MVSINESANAAGTGPSDVTALQLLSLDQIIPFTQYTRFVLPLDGYVFWLRTQTTQISGSLHAQINKRQNEDETISINRVVFTTAYPVQEFNSISPDIIWVGEYQNVKFAFTRSDLYRPTTLYHYTGDAVYPALQSQLVDTGAQLPLDTVIVSNSLPVWLALWTYNPVWLVPPNPGVKLYPSFAVPDNLPPPYGVVHIDPASTRSLQAAPMFGPMHPMGWAALGTVSGPALSATHWQLASDQVRVTLYGLTNQQALDFQDLVNRYSFDQDTIGVMNVPVVHDEKRTQAELGILAMKKTITFEVSYYQSRINDVARQLIESVTVNLVPG